MEAGFRHLAEAFGRLMGEDAGSSAGTIESEGAPSSRAGRVARAKVPTEGEEAGEVRKIIKPLRFNQSEWDTVRRAAQSAAVAPGTYIRSAALGTRPRARVRGVERETVAQLARVGNNLNQLAKKANAAGLDLEERQALAAALVEVREMIERLTAAERD
jgi:hypothetical protein